MTARLTLKPNPQADWRRVTWGHPDSVPTVICSMCAGALPEVPLMLFKPSGACARFCDDCAHDLFVAVMVPA